MTTPTSSSRHRNIEHQIQDTAVSAADIHLSTLHTVSRATTAAAAAADRADNAEAVLRGLRFRGVNESDGGYGRGSRLMDDHRNNNTNNNNNINYHYHYHSKLPVSSSSSSSFLSSSSSPSNPLHSSHLPAAATLLEIPDLINTCIHHGLLEDALRMDEYIRQLHAAHPSSATIAAIASAAHSAMKTLVTRLLATLRQPDLTLEESLRTLAYLRRLNVLPQQPHPSPSSLSSLSSSSSSSSTHSSHSSAPHPFLRKIFLQQRAISIRTAAQDAAKTRASAYRRAIQLIDVLKHKVFEVIIQYYALFEPANIRSFKSKSQMPTDSVMSSWVITTLRPFVNDITNLIRDIWSPNELQEIAKILQICGSSLSRINADLTVAFPMIFREQLTKIIINGLNTAVKNLNKTLKSYNIPTTETIITSKKQNNSKPPSILLDYVPLALLLNEELKVLNGLKTCNFILIPNLNRIFEKHVDEVIEIINQFNSETIISIFQKYHKPYLEKCIQSISIRSKK